MRVVVGDARVLLPPGGCPLRVVVGDARVLLPPGGCPLRVVVGDGRVHLLTAGRNRHGRGVLPGKMQKATGVRRILTAN